MLKLTKYFTVPFFIFFLLFSTNTPINATDNFGVDKTIGAAGKAGEALKNEKNQDIKQTVGRIIGEVLAFVGIIFFILILWAGFEWMTAAGSEEQTKKARSVINASIVGLIIILAAYVFTTFIGTLLVTP